MAAGGQVPAAEASATTPGGPGTQLAEAARTAGPGKPAIWRKAAQRRARGRLRPRPGHPVCQPQEAATRNQVRRLKRANVHYELEFRPQTSDNLVGALVCVRARVCVYVCQRARYGGGRVGLTS